MKNHQHIRQLRVKDLAAYLIRTETEPEYDEDLDGEWYCCGEHVWYVTPYGVRCWDYEDALEHTIDWLNSDYREDKENVTT